ncbi:MAG: hypothetical protein M3Y35_14145 [Actinomycetota bacterium]|nr:hypothetical protein [Actinomycetota bacterium]
MRGPRGGGDDAEGVGDDLTVWVVPGDSSGERSWVVGAGLPDPRRPGSGWHTSRLWWVIGVLAVAALMVAVIVVGRRSEQSSDVSSTTGSRVLAATRPIS